MLQVPLFRRVASEPPGGQPRPALRPRCGVLIDARGNGVTSRWYGGRAGLGGALFLVSDALIGTRLTGHDFPTRGPLVGLTYTIGQYQLAAGIVARHLQLAHPLREIR